jgi:hypothetical protein
LHSRNTPDIKGGEEGKVCEDGKEIHRDGRDRRDERVLFSFQFSAFFKNFTFMTLLPSVSVIVAV